MEEKSAYINATIFVQWMRAYFVPRKPLGRVLILEGHASHANSVEMLEFTESNAFRQNFSKSLKSHFYESCRLCLKNHAGRPIIRYQLSKLLNASWGKVTTNFSSAFKATGILLFNRDIVPDYAFLLKKLS
ncbi:hypothetical protein Trydic_g22522 [Trypoxylus dichotomus]